VQTSTTSEFTIISRFFSECWLLPPYGGHWAPSAKFCPPWTNV